METKFEDYYRLNNEYLELLRKTMGDPIVGHYINVVPYCPQDKHQYDVIPNSMIEVDDANRDRVINFFKNRLDEVQRMSLRAYEDLDKDFVYVEPKKNSIDEDIALAKRLLKKSTNYLEKKQLSRKLNQLIKKKRESKNER